jgi:hypothetical protein
MIHQEPNHVSHWDITNNGAVTATNRAAFLSHFFMFSSVFYPKERSYGVEKFLTPAITEHKKPIAKHALAI